MFLFPSSIKFTRAIPSLSSSLNATRLPLQSTLIPSILSPFREYAAVGKQDQKKGRSKKGKRPPEDARMVAIRRILRNKPRYREPKYKTSAGRREFRIKDEFIEKAWVMFKLREQEEYINSLKSKYDAMHAAMKSLEATDKKLYEGALVKNPEELFFSRRLRPPTQTPPLAGWRGNKIE